MGDGRRDLNRERGNISKEFQSYWAFLKEVELYKLPKISQG